MADPISIFGAAAGAVQIADTALRLSRKAYGFLCEVKDAKKDIVTLRDALRDAESNVRSLRNYIDEFARSRNATVEFEVLPSTITESIQGFRDDLNILAAILPVDLSPNLAKKIKWVFDKKKIKDVTKRLDRRKIDVIQITNSVGILHQLKTRSDNHNTHTLLQSTRQVVDQQSLKQDHTSRDLLDYSRATRDSHTQILSNLDTQRISHATTASQQVLHQTQTTQTLSHITDDIGAIQASQNQILGNLYDQRVAHDNAAAQRSLRHTQVIQTLSRVTNDTGLIRDSQSEMLTAIKGTHTSVDIGTSHLAQGQTRILHSIDGLRTQLNLAASSTIISASNADMLGRTFRAQLRSILPPLLEQSQAEAQIQNEARLRRLERMIDDISTQLSSGAASAHIFPSNTSPVPTSAGDDHIFHRSPPPDEHVLWRQPSGPTHDDTAPSNIALQRTTYTIKYQTFRRRWYFEWLIGNLAIEIETISQRRAYSSKSSTDFKISIQFWPSQALFAMPGIAIFSSSVPDQRGYYHVTPCMKTFPIISWNAPIWGRIRHGDIPGIQQLFVDGMASPRDQDSDGWTLLHIAIARGKFDVAQYLLSEGGDPTQKAYDGNDAYATLHILRFFNSDPIRGRLQLSEDSVNSTIALSQEFELAGCDYENWASNAIGLGIYSILEGTCKVPGTAYKSWTTSLLQRGSDVFGAFLEETPFKPDARHLALLRVMLEAGLDPNQTVGDASEPLLIDCLWDMRNEKWRTQREGEEESSDENSDTETQSSDEETDVETFDEEKLPLWCMVELLIRAGADIYIIYGELPRRFRRLGNHQGTASPEYICTPTTYAICYKVEEEWCEALRACDLDPDEVYEEDYRRRSRYVRLHGGDTTGVDLKELDVPSRSGMRKRANRVSSNDDV